MLNPLWKSVMMAKLSGISSFTVATNTWNGFTWIAVNVYLINVSFCKLYTHPGPNGFPCMVLSWLNIFGWRLQGRVTRLLSCCGSRWPDVHSEPCRRNSSTCSVLLLVDLSRIKNGRWFIHHLWRYTAPLKDAGGFNCSHSLGFTLWPAATPRRRYR